MAHVLYVIQRFENEKWLIQDVREGDSTDASVKKMAAEAYAKAKEWDASMPVRLIAYYGEGENRTGPIRVLNHIPG